jgi:predicted small lipoprotein YifL
MRRPTFAVLLLAVIALAACAKKSSLYLDSGRSESSEPAHSAKPPPTPAPPPTK